MSVWTENIIAEFHQKILSGCLKIWKIRQGITFFCRTLYMPCSHVCFWPLTWPSTSSTCICWVHIVHMRAASTSITRYHWPVAWSGQLEFVSDLVIFRRPLSVDATAVPRPAYWPFVFVSGSTSAFSYLYTIETKHFCLWCIYTVFSARQDSIYAIARYMPSPVRLSVRLSVPLSVTRVDQSKTVQDRITQPSPQSLWWRLRDPILNRLGTE